MPFPLLALVPPLIAWGTRAAAVYGLGRLFSEEPVQELKNLILGFVVEQAATRAGLRLDPDDPFSDASMATAVGERVGVPIRSLKDRAMIREDLDGFAASLISEKSGFRVSSVQNVAVLKADLQRIGCALIAERVGLPVGVLPGDGEELDGALVKERILTWAKAELSVRMTEEAGARLAEIQGLADVEGLADELNGKLAALGSDKLVTARRLAVDLAGRMATDAVADFGKLAVVMTKRSRKQELNRAAQAKFRAAHGNREKYVPLGMTAVIG